MEASRLARACALVSGAMGRSPAALSGVTAGEVARALERAAGIGDAAAADLLEPSRVEAVHPTWFTAPLARLPAACRAPLLGLLPRPVARFAALALERQTGQTVGDAPVARGRTAARLAARLVPPALIDHPGLQEPLQWISRNAGALPCESVYARWPGEARALEAGFEGAGAPARALVTLAACLAARADDARAVAAAMPFDAGAALLAARSRWVLALEPGEAEDLSRLLAGAMGEATP